MKKMTLKIKNLKLKIIFICLFAYAAFCLFPDKARANGISLGIYPPELQIQTSTPATITKQITIVNNSDDPVDLKILFKQFVNSSKENGEVFYLNQKDFINKSDALFNGTATIKDQTGKIIDQISLTPHQSQNLNLSLDINKTQDISDSYFSVLFVSNNNKTADSGSTRIAISGGMAMHVLIAFTNKHELAQGYIKSFSAPFFLEEGPVNFQVEAANTGNHFINPKGAILITNMYNQTIGKVDLLPVTILNHSLRFLPDNKLKSDTNAVWPEKFLLGLYKAKVIISMTNQGPAYEKITYFFDLPWQWMIGCIFLIGFVIIVAIRVRKRLK